MHSKALTSLLKRLAFHSSVLLPESFTLLCAELAPSATDLTVLSRGSSNYSPRLFLPIKWRRIMHLKDLLLR